MAFVALAAFDWYFLNGEYVRAAEAVAHSLATTWSDRPTLPHAALHRRLPLDTFLALDC
jgi:hypothetical protein